MRESRKWKVFVPELLLDSFDINGRTDILFGILLFPELWNIAVRDAL
jgi:hypothetical protein